MHEPGWSVFFLRNAFLQFVQESLPACSWEPCLWSCCLLQSLIHKHVHLGVCLLQPKSCLLTTEQMHSSGGLSALLKGTLIMVNEETGGWGSSSALQTDSQKWNEYGQGKSRFLLFLPKWAVIVWRGQRRQGWTHITMRTTGKMEKQWKWCKI